MLPQDSTQVTCNTVNRCLFFNVIIVCIVSTRWEMNKYLNAGTERFVEQFYVIK